MPFDPISSGEAAEKDTNFDPFSSGLAAEEKPKAGFDPFSSGIAEPEGPEEVRTRLFSPGSSDSPTLEDARTLLHANKAAEVHPLDALANGATNLWQGVKSAASRANQIEEEAHQDNFGPNNTLGTGGEPLWRTAARYGISGAAGLAEGVHGLWTAGRRALNSPGFVAARPLSEDEQAAMYLKKLQGDVAEARRQERVQAGQETLLPGVSAPWLTENKLLNPGTEELASYIPTPGMAPAIAKTFTGLRAATAPLSKIAPLGATAGQRAVQGLAKGVARGAEVTETAADAPLKLVEQLGGPATVAGVTGIADTAAAAAGVPSPARLIPAIKAGANTVKKAAQAVGAAAEGSTQSEQGFLAQLARNENAPDWVKGVAQKARLIPGAETGIREGIGAADSAIKGAMFQGALGGAGADTPDEALEQAGSGAALGALAHVTLRPLQIATGADQIARQNFDLGRWLQRRTPEEVSALNGWDRNTALAASRAEFHLNGVAKDSNVRFTYLPDSDPRVQGVSGVNLVADEQGQPRIYINADRATEGRIWHEVFDLLQRSPEATDTGDLHSALFPVTETDEKGNVVRTLRPGMFSQAEYGRFVDRYLSLMPEGPGKAGLLAEQADNPGKFRLRMRSEMSSELFSTLDKNSPGGLLDDMNSTTRRVLDWMLTSEQDTFLHRIGRRLEASLGRAPGTTTELDPSLRLTPEGAALFRQYSRQRDRLSQRLTFDDNEALEGIRLNRDELLKPGSAKLLDAFGDSDIFQRDPNSPRPDKIAMSPNGQPLLASERDVKRVQTDRAAALMKALASVPDAGTAGAMRLRKFGDNDEGYMGRFFTDAQLDAIEKLVPQDLFTPSMMTKLRHINSIAREQGKPMVLHYNSALSGKGKYSSSLGESVRVGTPHKMYVTKAKNFVVETFDHTAAWDKMNRWFRDKPGAVVDFEGKEDFQRKLYQYLDNHEASQPGMSGLDPDPVKAKRMANRINDFLNMHRVDTEGANPDRISGTATKDKLFRSRRLDRINRISESGANRTPLDYEKVVANFSPGARRLPKSDKLSQKMWLEPDGKFSAANGLHVDWLRSNADRLRKAGFDPMKYPATDDVDGPRVPALGKGFGRVTYTPNSGTLSVEIGQAGWTKTAKDAIFTFLSDNAKHVDNIGINILNRQGNVVDGGFARLFNYSDREKLNHIPLISEADGDSEGARFSPPLEEKPVGEMNTQELEQYKSQPWAQRFLAARKNKQPEQATLGLLTQDKHINDLIRALYKDRPQGDSFDSIVGRHTALRPGRDPEAARQEIASRKVGEKTRALTAALLAERSGGQQLPPDILNKLALGTEPKTPARAAADRSAELLQMSDEDFADVLARAQRGEPSHTPEVLQAARAARQALPILNLEHLVYNDNVRSIGEGSESDVFVDNRHDRKFVYKIFKQPYGETRQGFSLNGVERASGSDELRLTPELASLPDLISSLDRFNRFEGTAPTELVGLNSDGALVVKQPYMRRAAAERDVTRWMQIYNAERDYPSSLSDRAQDTGFNHSVGQNQPILRDPHGNAYVTADVRASNMMVDGDGNPWLTDGMIRPITPDDIAESPGLTEFKPSSPENIRYSPDASGVDKANEERGIPAKYLGYQEGPNGKGFHLFNLTKPLGNHPADSTVSEKTLLQAGFKPAVPGDQQFSPSPEPLDLGELKLNRYAKRILTWHQENGGSTFNPTTGRMLADKPFYAVSVFPDRTKIVEGQPTKEQIADYLKANLDVLGDKHNSVGTWFDKESGKTYLDVTVTDQDRGFAEYLGKKYNQKAIFDIKNLQEIPTGGTGDPIEALPPGPERTALALKEYRELTKARGMDMFSDQILPESMLKNVRDLDLAKPEQTAVKGLPKVGQDINRDVLRKRVQLLPSIEDRVRVRRALQEGFKEVSEYLDREKIDPQFDSGREWYRKDVEKMEKTTNEIFPETKNPVQMGLFKLLLATLSPSAKPAENYRSAAEGYAAYLQDGKFSALAPTRINEEGESMKLGVQAVPVADKLNALKAQFGGNEGEMLQYLLTPHERTLSGQPDTYGAYDLGPKVGAFFLNLNGLSDAVTVDLWATRTWNRYMGTLFRAEKGGKRGIQNAPTDADRPLIQEAFKQIADQVSKETGQEISPMDVQATLWFYEKDLYEKYGASVDRGLFGEAAERYKAAPIHTSPEPTTLKDFGKKDKQQKLQI